VAELCHCGQEVVVPRSMRGVPPGHVRKKDRHLVRQKVVEESLSRSGLPTRQPGSSWGRVIRAGGLQAVIRMHR